MAKISVKIQVPVYLVEMSMHDKLAIISSLRYAIAHANQSRTYADKQKELLELLSSTCHDGGTDNG